MGVRVGPVSEDQATEYVTAMGRAFGFDSDEEMVRRFARTFEWDRALAAYDGDQIAGTIGAHSLEMTVPGATMRCGGTTVVAVLPTHRRQGLLRQMIDAHFDDVWEREEPIAALWASDSAIYGRFGYGIATATADVTVRRDHTAFHRLAPAPAPVRMVERDEALELFPPFYDRVRREQPGFLARPDLWWETRRFRDDRSSREGASAYRFVVSEENGSVTGFVQYRFKSDWEGDHGGGVVKVRELVGATPESWAGLWRFILNHDLTKSIEAENRALDDPLFGLLAGFRRAKTKVGDGMWVRIMDVVRALEGRSYSAEARATIRLHDPLDASVSLWGVEVSPEGAEVTRGESEPDVEMDIEDLSACFMGWSRFQQLGRDGRVVGAPETLAALDRAFSWSPTPWCPEIF